MTPKPMPASSPNLPTDHSGKLFGIVYIILTGVIDTIIPATELWSWVGKSASYLLKLAPLLWWALPVKKLAQVTPEKNRPAAQDWIPDTMALSVKSGQLFSLGQEVLLLVLPEFGRDQKGDLKDNKLWVMGKEGQRN
ncbi:hypothetical protein DSO57_1023367 [Entomophthora muscae]|uniref:Uncharacterized protein n=1 Tax=Entomophthora muscae TaxID=34485 RepID=A0ACC2S4R2_9FUNG|nr:hypothetical protein DSO57_1023367 [Entomophthora muscae]